MPATDIPSTAEAAASAFIPGLNNAATRNTEEIDLDESQDEDDGGAGEGGDGGAALRPGSEEGTAGHLNSPALAEAQALIDQIVARNENDGSTAGTKEGEPHASSLLPGGAPGDDASALPKRPSASWGQQQGSLPNIGQEGGNHGYGRALPVAHGQGRGQGQRREHGKPWWEGYYDPASNQNPWAALEKKAGLESRGSWLS
ncbi:hypothetical protein ACRALDRAFT_1060190 [Sodiomyces alcalophilus JCM 7366]|uniref:uncharacterized protein n=1 Tax=Sodiomyces alcalophilus JCM 7366 TaxID=591952 RepID=UPI0039B3AB1B